MHILYFKFCLHCTETLSSPSAHRMVCDFKVSHSASAQGIMLGSSAVPPPHVAVQIVSFVTLLHVIGSIVLSSGTNDQLKIYYFNIFNLTISLNINM